MNKKFLKKAVALGIAGLTALPALSLISSAELTMGDNGYVTGTIYKVYVKNEDGIGDYKYFTTSEDAAKAGTNVTAIDVTDLKSSKIYVKDHEISTTDNGGTVYTTTYSESTSISSGSYSSYYHYYSSVTGLYYH
ncbi:MAG: hypothetical protein J1F11_08400, partial [Oscillospiraceae bacterium]|nr:hypothetical protein [Oscillospiraceae bacterium]